MAVADTQWHLHNRVVPVVAAMLGADGVRGATEMADEARGCTSRDSGSLAAIAA